MQLESANATRCDQTARFLHGIGTAHGIHARESHDDVAVFGGERCHFVVGNLRAAGEALVD